MKHSIHRQATNLTSSLLVAIFTQSLLALVRGNFMTLTFFAAGHSYGEYQVRGLPITIRLLLDTCFICSMLEHLSSLYSWDAMIPENPRSNEQLRTLGYIACVDSIKGILTSLSVLSQTILWFKRN